MSRRGARPSSRTRTLVLAHGLALLALAGSAGAGRAQILGKILDAGEKAQEVAGKAQSVLPIETPEEVRIGRGIAATLAGYYTLARDSALTDYVTLVGLAVAEADPRSDIRYRFGVLDSDAVNALSAPGGYVFVTRGALALMEDEAELAGVLAHEVAHVNRRHVVREIQKRARTSLGAEATQAALDADGAVFDQVVGLGTNVLFLGLSRDDELEADSLGVAYAAAAGYDPAGLARFVTKLRANEAKPFLAALKATHPKPDVRLATIERSAKATGRATGEGAEAAVTLPERFQSAAGGGTPPAS
ncbi:MAG: M48 family metalloprotease [Gemmatimonadetes bacterium]|nr:M48 family metalloprotease [Gemmatimonadota bacterium]